jgi:hypothetical protein
VSVIRQGSLEHEVKRRSALLETWDFAEGRASGVGNCTQVAVPPHAGVHGIENLGPLWIGVCLAKV